MEKIKSNLGINFKSSSFGLNNFLKDLKVDTGLNIATRFQPKISFGKARYILASHNKIAKATSVNTIFFEIIKVNKIIGNSITYK